MVSIFKTPALDTWESQGEAPRSEMTTLEKSEETAPKFQGQCSNAHSL